MPRTVLYWSARGYVVGVDQSGTFALMKVSMCSPSWATELKEAPCRDLPCRIENKISTWLSHEARVGVKWNPT
jgi:hypothetical protein